MAAPPSHPNVLAGQYIDRAALWRKDEARVRAALDDPATLFVPVWNARSMVHAAGGSMAAYLIERAQAVAEIAQGEPILLGEFRNRCCFAVSLFGDEPPALGPAVELHDLRLIAGELPAEEAGLLAYARGMVHWRENHRHCGRCGARTVAAQGGHVLHCSAESCATQHFPRIDPAVIVLITDGERVLLGRQPSWPPGRYSTIAGFVEPGESLEDAIVREVREETGIEIASVHYHSSQPWPFPSSLMLGFTAYARSTEIRRWDEELEDARWLTRAELAAGEVALPTTHSVSFRLLEDWYDAGAPVRLRSEPHVRMWRRTG